MPDTVNLDKNVEITRIDLPKTSEPCVSAMYAIVFTAATLHFFSCTVPDV